MPTLKYLDPATGTYVPLPGIVGATGPRGDLGVVIERPAYGAWYRYNNQTISNITTTQVIFDTENYQAPIGMSIDAAGTVTVAEAGLYMITAHVSWAGNTVGNRYGFIYAGAPPNGTSMGRVMTAPPPAGVFTGMVLSKTRYLNAGDVIRVSVYQSSGGNLDLFNDTVNRASGLEVARIPAAYSGSAVSTFGERTYSTTRRSVVAQSFTTATTQVVTWEVVDDDNGISYNTSTGEFTVPVTGYYDVSAAVHFATGTTGNRVILIYVNGGVKAAAQMGASSTGGTSPTISRTVLLNAGDLVKIYAGQGSGATVLLTTSGAYNWVTITKVPAPVINGAAASGVWGTAPLDSFLYGSNSLIGREIYVDVNGQLRAKPDVVELGGGVDLNTITRTGNWTQSQTADAGTGTNYPVALAGLLEVVTNNSSMVWQRYTVYSSGLPSTYSYGNVYTRGSYQGNWYPWRVVLPSDTGWVAIGIAATFAAHPSDPAMLRKIGNVVHAKGAFAPTGMAVSTTFQPGIIPAGFEPVSAFYQAAGCSAGNITASFVIGAGAGFGGIQVRCGPILSTYYYLSGSWTID